MSSPTRLSKRLTRFLLQGLVFLVCLALLLEAIGRTVIDRVSPAESFGLDPSPMGMYFEIKWYRLQHYVAKNGGVDVILVGSSVVNTGLNPDVIAQTYYDETGQKLRIFNFGVESLDIVPTSEFTKILIEQYHPALIIFGTIPRDYLTSDNQDVNSAFLANPWIQYRSGQPNFMGWLIDHSAAMLHFLPYRNWMRADFLSQQAKYQLRYQRTSASGYEIENFIAKNLDQHPDPNSPDEVDAFAKYHDYTMDPARLADLQAILNLQKETGTHVLVMDIPLAPTFSDYMGGSAIYQGYQQTLEKAVQASGALFLSADGAPRIPPDGRSDREHLNRIGAPVLSSYLGHELAILTTSDPGLVLNHGGQ